LVDGGLRGAVVDGSLDGGGRGPFGLAEDGVGGAPGDLGEMAGDVAGVDLGLGAGGHVLAGVADEVGAAVGLEGGGVGERDVLRGQFTADVVVGEAVAPGE
jgi:hypothetical protein